MDRTALYAGSFDPLTLGHLDIIERAAALYDTVVVGVVANPGKSSLFSLDERVAMVCKACEGIANVRVESFEGLLADYVNKNKFDAVVRGLRSCADFEYEMDMAHINATLYDSAETVFLMTKPELSFVSSSMVKEVASLGGKIDGFVTEDIKNQLINKYGRNN